MEIKDVKLTQQGKTVEGDPMPGKYYRVDVQDSVDIKKAALEFKKKFPKSFFMFRTNKPKTPVMKNEVPATTKN